MRLPILGFCLCVAIASCSRSPSTDKLTDAGALRPDAAPEGSSSGPTSGSPGAENASITAPVGLDGKLTLRKPPPDAGKARLYARSLRTWIYDSPRPSAQKLGAIRLGASVPVRPESVSKEGCPGGFYAVIPNGFLCRGEEATLDPNDDWVRIGAEYPPDTSRRLPYFYGTVRKPGPIYRKLPSTDERKSAEPDIDRRMKAWLLAPGEIGASYGQRFWLNEGETLADPAAAWESQATDPLPWYVADGKTLPRLGGKGPASSPLTEGTMAPHLGFSILKTFLFEGRRYGLTTDLFLVPTDRLRPIQGSSFHGFQIPQEIDFPFAIVRAPSAHLYEFDKEKNRLVPKQDPPYRSAVKLTGKQNFFRNRLHFETADGLWLSDRDASRLDYVRRMPAWGSNGEKWIDINITKQTAVLYEGTRAVYATLVSTGEAGLQESENSTATVRGIFRIHTKYLTATMSSDEAGEEFELRDVPYVQYFENGYALHGAYWHDRFGVPKSHGCINLSPEDARRIFYWTDPPLPPNYHAVLKPLKGTVLFVHP